MDNVDIIRFMENTGLVYVFTGEGKGKTSAALGVTVRGLLNGWRVCWISLYKEESWGLSEKGLVDKFDRLEMHFVGQGFYFDGKYKDVGNKGNKVVNKATDIEHKRAMDSAVKLFREKIITGSYDLIVVDEINNALTDGLIKESVLTEIIKMRNNSHIIMTGRGENKEIVKEADLVSRIEKVKHPYDRGVLAVKGLDY